MSTMSKRAQARTERELQDILSQPGNSACADCGTRNPAWASWSIGIFLCMRCATLHRKLGTHISKVKSLTMDTWTDEQVQNMRSNGNTAVNRVYNPKNKQPDMPLDADEVDNAMERFIRKKYQEKSLSDGRPEVPTRDNPPITRSKSPDTPASPILPPKKKGFWTGFGLRASSSAYPLSKHDKKHRNEPRVDSAFRISSEDYTPKTKTDSRTVTRRDITNSEVEAKLLKLREMGFTDVERNTLLLKKARGDVELVIASLIKQAAREDDPRKPASGSAEFASSTAKSGNNLLASQSAPPTEPSNNPFNTVDRTQPYGNGQTQQQPVAQAPALNTNPWQTAMSPQQSTGLEQSFGAMQVNSSPLFPHNTGGYATQADSRFTQSMTPPVPTMPQAYSAAASPISGTNPFAYQTPLSAHSTGSNPYAASMMNTPSFAPSTNLFLLHNAASTPASPSLTNPFGLPPTPARQQNNVPFTSPHAETSAFITQSQPSPFLQNLPYQGMSPATSSPGIPNFDYGQSAGTMQQPLQYPQTANNNQHAYQSFHHQQQQQQQQYQPLQQSLMPQQTGRYDKNSIMALYSHPQIASQRQLAAIPEPADPDQYAQDSKATSPANLDVQPLSVNTSTRSVSMPIHSAGQVNRNPFMTNGAAVATNTATSAHSTSALPQFSPLGQNNPYASTTPQSQSMMSGNPFGPQGGTRHASADSVSVNNPALMDGRHSPDAWGGLSARYVR